MAASLSNALIVNLFVVFLMCKVCYSLKHKHSNSSTKVLHWSTAGATWYGSPNGAGSDGGSCGYGNLVSQAPFASMVTGIGPSLYKSGKECGACYMIKCRKNRWCSRKMVRVVITDFCPGGVCVSDTAHFDLSGTAFGAMALPGHQHNLRDAGIIQIRFARVPCDYSGKNIAFHVDQGSNPNYIAVVIEYEEGDGDLGRVALQQANTNSNSNSNSSSDWLEMRQSWGAVWQLNPGFELKPPLSIRLTSQYSAQTLVAKNVIPIGWTPGATYRSLVNYL